MILKQKSKYMECVICKNGTISTGKVSVTFERNNSIVVVKDVSAHVCNNCGHYYLLDSIAEKVFSLANESIERGSEVEVLRLKQAS
jgi:YgiT-type zinc finger domain-containing protein